MTRIKVTEDIGNSLAYIISNYNTSELAFLYENPFVIPNKKHKKALEVMGIGQLFDAFTNGYEVVKALEYKDLPRFFKVKDHDNNVILECELMVDYILVSGTGDKDVPRFPCQKEQVLKLINDNTWEILKQGDNTL